MPDNFLIRQNWVAFIQARDLIRIIYHIVISTAFALKSRMKGLIVMSANLESSLRGPAARLFSAPDWPWDRHVTALLGSLIAKLNTPPNFLLDTPVQFLSRSTMG